MYTCEAEGCTRKALCRNLCSAHYYRAKRNGIESIYDRPLQMPKGGLSALGIDSKHPFYTAWANMKTRCDNHRSTQYRWYGGKGIHYCKEWGSFKNFYTDMWPSWQSGLTLERRNVDLGYNKDNCTWIPYSEQASNRTSCRKYAWGETHYG